MGSDKHSRSRKRKYSDDSEDGTESSGEATSWVLLSAVYSESAFPHADASQQHHKSKKHKKEKGKKVKCWLKPLGTTD